MKNSFAFSNITNKPHKAKHNNLPNMTKQDTNDRPAQRDAEDAADFFDELLRAYTAGDSHRAYAGLAHGLDRLLAKCTSMAHVRFTGTFARLDYLLKERKASAEMTDWANVTRTRIRRANDGRMGDNDMDEALPVDFKALCTLTSWLLDTDIPDSCQRLFTSQTITVTRRKELIARERGYVRMVVDRWDSEYIYGRTDTGGAETAQVCYVRGNDNYPYDRSYLAGILSEGSQLNLVRPRIEDGIIYPELIIYEPDLLEDISSIASCFENYTESPVLHLLNRLRPNQQTPPTVLGNLASQLLDEEVRSSGKATSYRESAQAFMRDNAMTLLTTGLPAQFHADAQAQKANIHDAIGTALPKLLADYRPDDVILEPSFFAEMLGLQGRMDFLQMDFSILIEQKSGKGGFPQRDPDTPVPGTKHYIQMLLYMALIRYNYRQQYDRNSHRMQAMLLYSKYRNSLLPLGFAPQLLFEALRMRNLMAHAELGYARGGMRMLAKLTADGLNTRGTRGKLWEQYQRPQIEELLQPIREASDVERAYYFRFLEFIEKEHLLSKFGSEDKEGSGFAAKWHDSLDEKQQAGNICAGMRLLSPTPDDTGRVEQVRLSLSQDDGHGMMNFRRGDIVVLYCYRPCTVPDVRQAIAHRCTIAEITADDMTLRLRAPQSNPRAFTLFSDMEWAVEHDFFDSSFSSLYRAMHSFLSAPKDRRDLIMLQRAPRVDKSLTLRGDYGAFNDLSLRVRQARDMFLIIGPPGTGKTSYGLMNTLNEELSDPEATVLLLSFTNRAVDEICSKLVEQGTDFIRLGSELSCSDAYRPFMLSSIAAEADDIRSLRRRMDECRVVVGTTAALNSAISLFGIKQFSLTIIDEASQILEPHLIGLLSATHDGRPAIGRFVMIGDHKQLPAVVQQRPEESRVTEPKLHGILLEDCRLSLFERMLRRYGDDPQVCHMLQKQGRMHPDIALFPNHEFYEGKLEAVPLPHQKGELACHTPLSDTLDRMLGSHRVLFMDIETPKASLSDKVNTAEAEAIADILAHVYRMTPDFNPDTSAGVIVPYRNQITAVRNALAHTGIKPLTQIAVDTVERYQGSQRDCIVYGFTVQRPYQLDFLANNTFEEDGQLIDRKLNVAMTRARERLIMVGSVALLSRNVTFSRLVSHVRRHGGLI